MLGGPVWVVVDGTYEQGYGAVAAVAAGQRHDVVVFAACSLEQGAAAAGELAAVDVHADVPLLASGPDFDDADVAEVRYLQLRVFVGEVAAGERAEGDGAGPLPYAGDEAEPLARECVLARLKKMPNDPRTFNAQSLLGGCLLGLKQYDKAEPLLLSSYEPLALALREKKIPWEGRYVVNDMLKRIIQLYDGDTRRPLELFMLAWSRTIAFFKSTLG